MNAKRILTVVLAAALTTASPALWGDPSGTHKSHQTTPPANPSAREKRARAAGPADDALGAPDQRRGKRRLIHDYFRHHAYSEQSLPPGIAKNLARGKPLPPGIAKRYLPQELRGELRPRPGYEWLALGRDIALVVAATGVIVDILHDVF